MKTIKFIFNIILKALFIFLLLLIFLLLIYFVSIKVSQKRGTLNKIPINLFVILTQSMEPAIKPGDVVVDYSPKNKKYNVGDIITYVATEGYHSGSSVTHRVIEIVEKNGEYLYRTQGDANNTADFSLVSSKNIIGKVIFKIPKVGYVRQFLVTKVGWVFIVIFPCLVIIGCDGLKRIKKVDKLNKVIIDNKNLAIDTDKEDGDDDEEDFWGID